MTPGIREVDGMREAIWQAESGVHAVWWDANGKKVGATVPESGEGMAEARERARDKLLGVTSG